MPIYSLMCSECLLPMPEIIVPYATMKKACEEEECPGCSAIGTLVTNWSEMTFTYVPTKGMPDYDMRIMDERYKKRNARLDKMPKDNQDRMGTFMKKYGVRATAPAIMPSKPKPKSQE